MLIRADRHPDWNQVVSSRHFELLEELHVAHAEAARLSKLMIALQTKGAGDQAELQGVARNKTALVIAHRLSTVVDAHQILVMELGRIIERGTHAQLLALNGRYAEMWRLQQAGDESG